MNEKDLARSVLIDYFSQEDFGLSSEQAELMAKAVSLEKIDVERSDIDRDIKGKVSRLDGVSAHSIKAFNFFRLKRKEYLLMMAKALGPTAAAATGIAAGASFAALTPVLVALFALIADFSGLSEKQFTQFEARLLLLIDEAGAKEVCAKEIYSAYSQRFPETASRTEIVEAMYRLEYFRVLDWQRDADGVCFRVCEEIQFERVT